MLTNFDSDKTKKKLNSICYICPVFRNTLNVWIVWTIVNN